MNTYGPMVVVTALLTTMVTVLCYFAVHNPTSVGFLAIVIVPMITLIQSCLKPAFESKQATKKNEELVARTVQALTMPPPAGESDPITVPDNIPVNMSIPVPPKGDS